MYLVANPSPSNSEDCVELQFLGVGDECVEDLLFCGCEFDELIVFHG